MTCRLHLRTPGTFADAGVASSHDDASSDLPRRRLDPGGSGAELLAVLGLQRLREHLTVGEPIDARHGLPRVAAATLDRDGARGGRLAPADSPLAIDDEWEPSRPGRRLRAAVAEIHTRLIGRVGLPRIELRIAELEEDRGLGPLPPE